MKTRRVALAVVCLAVAFGSVSGALAANGTAGTWTATASIAIPRADVTATRLASGRVLVVGGVNEPTTELYDPATASWFAGGTFNQPRWLHAAARLADGRVLVAGGGAYTATAEICSPATNRWTPLAA